MRFIAVFMILASVVRIQSEVPDGYVENKAAGKAYKVVYHSQTWNRAKLDCEIQDSTLAVPKSEDEFLFLQNLVRGMYYPHITGTNYKLLVWLGINNLEDYTIWKNLDGENIDTSGFSQWASSNVGFSNDPKEPHCAGMDARNPGLRDYWCHLRQPYICEIQVASDK